MGAIAGSPGRRGMVLALVLAALVLAGALAAGAVMAAGQGMRDASGAVARARALGAAEGALARALSPAEWDSGAAMGAPAGLVAVRTHSMDGGAIGDSVRIVRLGAEYFLVVAVGFARAPAASQARLAMLVTVDGAAHPARARAHSWSTMP